MTTNPTDNPNKPIFAYDGDCDFCAIWVAHWRRLTGDRIDYEAAQQIAEQYPQITREAFARAAQLIQPNGAVSSGAEAIYRLLKDTPRRGWLLRLYERLPGFAGASRAVYGTIAKHRNLAYWATMLLWGRSLGPHRYTLTRWLFLRALGVIYLVAFISHAVQVKGLIGSAGILPAKDYLDAIARAYPDFNRFLLVPTLAWINSSDAFLQFLCFGGIFLSALLILDIAALPALVLLWGFYLSIVNVGQDFLSFQWDILLLESGFLAIFLSSFHLLPRISKQRAPSLIVIYLFRWLLFRLMFMSGAVKLLSRDPTWRSLSALSFHYWTQPLPSPLAWYMAQLPAWFMQLSTAFTFVVELIVPFLFFLPRRLRMAGGLTTILLQGLIIATGNYTFFNWLTIALCIPLFDDDALAWLFPRRLRDLRLPPASTLKQVIAAAVGVVLVFVSGARLLSTLDSRVNLARLPAPLAQVYNRVSGLYLTSGYGLFARMTTTRPEIIIEGSDDGEHWLAYEFPYKAGDVNRMPLYVAPYQPRLDWQMWFAALGSYRSSGWFVSFVYRLLEGSPDVLALLAENPFPDHPPTYIRAQLYQYHFTTAEERAETGAWWRRELVGAYLPPVSLSDFTRTP